MFYYVYILQSLKDESTYIGSTTDLRRRFKEHNKGMVKSTKAKIPWRLIYYEAFLIEETARKREKSIKTHGNIRRKLLDRVLRSLDNLSTQ